MGSLISLTGQTSPFRACEVLKFTSKSAILILTELVGDDGNQVSWIVPPKSLAFKSMMLVHLKQRLAIRLVAQNNKTHFSIMFPNPTFSSGGIKGWEEESFHFQEPQRNPEATR